MHGAYIRNVHGFCKEDERVKRCLGSPLQSKEMGQHVTVCRIRADAERTSKKQGKFGSDIPASHEALSSRMRERGNGIDGPESPPSLSNRIRAHCQE